MSTRDLFLRAGGCGSAFFLFFFVILALALRPALLLLFFFQSLQNPEDEKSCWPWFDVARKF